jgi:hypothetical protein
MPDATILEFHLYKRTHNRNTGLNNLKEYALDKCEQAFLCRDWKAFDKWLRIFATIRSLAYQGYCC